MRETKPENAPEHLARAISIANELEEDSIVCDGFDYPTILDYLDPFEYACLIAIKAARRASENKAMKQPQQKPEPPKVDFAHLKQLSRGY